jgi:glycosyltransferase involved in cell wall biosynthesis
MRSRGRGDGVNTSRDLRALYVCYFGLREPLVQTQVLPYLRELARGGVSLHLMTFEPERRKRWAAADVVSTRETLRADGIEWHIATYHKRPTLLAKLFDIAAGLLRTIAIARRSRVNVIHARSDIPALIALLARPFTNARVIFDIRGLMADEYADAEHWRASGLLYRLTKMFERALFRADAFVVLTDRARAELLPAMHGKPLEVIPCCFDPVRWERASGIEVREAIGADGRTVIVYAGSLGGAYLTRELAEFFREAQNADPTVFLLVLTQSPETLITTQLASAAISADDYLVRRVAPAEMPAWLAAADIAISLVKPSYSKIAMSPTKFAEYLASGLPVISTRGIGDLDAQIERERVGVLLDDFTPASYRRAFLAANALRQEPGFRGHAAAVAQRLYDLHAVGGVRYLRLYSALAGELA